MQTVSLTAYAIATARAMESSRPEGERLFDDPYAKIFAAGADEAAIEGTKRFLGLPFLLEAIRLRTRFNDDFVREGLAAGIDQVVLMGAGFDARGLRLREIAERGARVWELDFPAVLDRKRALLDAAGVKLPPHVAYVACDFMNPDYASAARSDLAASGFRLGGGALFVWEGVIAYIDRAAIDRTLAFMASAGGPGSRVTFEFVPDGFLPDTAEKIVTSAGFDRIAETRYDHLWRQWLEGDPHANASMLRSAVAEIG